MLQNICHHYGPPQKFTALNGFRPVAPSVVMKVFEHLVLAHLKAITHPLLGPLGLLQFAYRANRTVDDLVNMALHFMLKYLNSPGTHARVLFVDFSSAFKTVVPQLLQVKLSQLAEPDPICQWIVDFLTKRGQQESVVKILKSADGTTVAGLIANGDVHRMEVEQLVSWCSTNHLLLNTQKTVEIVVGFRCR